MRSIIVLSYEGRKLRHHKNLYGVVKRAKPTMWWLGVLLLCGLILDIIVKSISTSAARPTDDLSNGTGLAGED